MFLSIFEKQVRRIMSERVFEHDKNYRLWSLTGQGFLRLTTKNGDKIADCRGTGKEDSSNTKILLTVLL